MHFVGLLILVILACLFLTGTQGCQRKRPIGAMCYVVVPTPPTAEYTCSVCGQKTLYDKDEAAWVVQSIESCRKEFELLVGECPLKLTLDESSLCANCSPKATQHQLTLTVTYPDGTVHTAAPIQLDDIRLLQDYFRGRLSTTNATNPAFLQNQTLRLQRLLGEQLPDPNSIKPD